MELIFNYRTVHHRSTTIEYPGTQLNIFHFMSGSECFCSISFIYAASVHNKGHFMTFSIKPV